jgi:hypothetical protein
MDEPRSADPSHGLPERIGPYRVKRVLARGGMGVAYEAEQDNPRRSATGSSTPTATSR